MKEHSPNKFIVGHLNIHSLRNIFSEDAIFLDILLQSEAKLVNLFPSA